MATMTRSPTARAGRARYIRHHNEHRPHRSLEQRPRSRNPPPATTPLPNTIGRRDLLGGLLHDLPRARRITGGTGPLRSRVDVTSHPPAWVGPRHPCQIRPNLVFARARETESGSRLDPRKTKHGLLGTQTLSSATPAIRSAAEAVADDIPDLIQRMRRRRLSFAESTAACSCERYPKATATASKSSRRGSPTKTANGEAQ
jgi:hypothetical protein